MDAVDKYGALVPTTGLLNRIVVTQASDLAVIDSTKEYFIDGVIDMGSQAIEVPAGGINIRGYSFDLSKLISSSPGHTMFTSPVGGSGNIIIQDIAIEVTGAGAQVYNLTDATGFNAFEMTRINYNDCVSLGTFTDYRQGFEQGTGRFGGTPSLTFAGTWIGGFIVSDSIVRGLDFGMSTPLFNLAVGQTFASRFLLGINVDLNTTPALTNAAPSNFTSPNLFQLENCLVTRNGGADPTDATVLPNISGTDKEAKFRNNEGIMNTHMGGVKILATELVTNIVSVGVPALIQGVWTSSNFDHFDTNVNSPEFTFLASSPNRFIVQGNIILDGTANNDITLYIRLDNGATIVPIYSITRNIQNSVGGVDVAIFSFRFPVDLQIGDRIFTDVANQTGTSNITVTADSIFTIEEG